MWYFLRSTCLCESNAINYYYYYYYCELALLVIYSTTLLPFFQGVAFESSLQVQLAAGGLFWLASLREQSFLL